MEAQRTDPPRRERQDEPARCPGLAGKRDLVGDVDHAVRLQHVGLGSLLEEAAGKLGVDPGTVLGGLSQVLPHAVDHLTPDGELPQGQGGGFNLGMLEGLAGRLLG